MAVLKIHIIVVAEETRTRSEQAKRREATRSASSLVVAKVLQMIEVISLDYCSRRQLLLSVINIVDRGGVLR